jgi:rRNA maturation protein Rpf1
LKEAIPNTEYYERGNFRVKEITEGAIKRGFTDLMLFYEKHGNPRKKNKNLNLCRYFDFIAFT